MVTTQAARAGVLLLVLLYLICSDDAHGDTDVSLCANARACRRFLLSDLIAISIPVHILYAHTHTLLHIRQISVI